MGKLISIIIPVYNQEKYLNKCLDSILNQTYSDLEILLVNDYSTDKSLQIINDYIKCDDRIRVINHKKNEGLFQARISGLKIATGDFVMFVDSDDSISIDWVRTLLNTATSENCDIVAGDFCYDYGNDNLQTEPLNPFTIKDWDLRGDDVLDEYMKQEGSHFSWHVVWNKLYKKKLFDNKLKDLEKYSHDHGHMIMWEDVAFSSSVWTQAKHFKNTHGAYYYKGGISSTSEVSSKGVKYEKMEKYINDVHGAMLFFKEQLLKSNRFNKGTINKNYNEWLKKAASYLYQDSFNGKSFTRKKLQKLIEEKFNIDCDKLQEINNYFGRIQTPISNQFFRLEECLKLIQDKKTKVVSFDIFDTLVKRPTLRPTDIFEIISNEINNKFNLKCVDFSALRINAENRAREVKYISNKTCEEITLDEIYQTLEKETMISKKILQYAKIRELELEEKMCKRKELGYVLFNFAKSNRKKIIITSDMYLPKDIIVKILNKNGYFSYNNLYLSSELKMTKARGTLYKYIQKDLKIKKSSEILHIGDNWQSDVITAQKFGWKSYHFSKSEDLLFNRNQGVYTGNAVNRVMWRNPMCIDMKSYEQFLSTRCMLGLMAFKCFDVPYISTNADSDYNSDPNRIGYMTLGPHILAVCTWIRKIAISNNINTVHFVARDGYIIKKAFETLYDDNKVGVNYIRLSRKALILADVEKTEDLYSLINKINPWNCTARNLVSYLKPAIPEEKFENAERIFKEKEIMFDTNFNGIQAFNEAMKLCINQLFDFNLLRDYQSKMKEYFSSIVKEGDYIFDVGYSGRPEEALSCLLGFPVGSLYIHTNNEVAMKRQKIGGSESYNFYHHKPIITGVLREHLLMELGPSTIGYEIKNKKVSPIFEKYKENYESTLITTQVQNGALEFVQDFKFYFGEFMDGMDIRQDDFSALFEDYLHFSKDFDGELFRCVPFEDDIGLGHKLSLFDEWKREVYNYCPIASGTGRTIETGELKDLYLDGYFVKMYKILNKKFPKYSKKREAMKKLASIFIK